MAGYTRQSTASIINGSSITAPPINAEFNQLLAAFNASTGHTHNGATGDGAYIPLIADTNARNKVVVNTSTNQIGVFVEVSNAAVEQLRFSDGAIIPVITNDIDLGTSGLEFKDLYLDGTAHIDTLDVDINGAVAGTFTIGSTLGVTGTTTLSTANITTGVITSVDINSGAIDNVTIGGSTAGVGSFTTLNASGTSTLATVDINGGAIDGTIIGANTAAAATVTALTASGTSTLSTVDINGGAIDGTTIGASSAAAGSFTTVTTSGQATLASVDINGGNIDGTIIGASSTAAITGTTITGSSFVGPLTGNVTGNTAGVHTGNVTGNVTGNITAGSGTSTLNNLTVNGTLDVTGTTIANVTDPTNAQDAATKNYVDTEVSALVDSSPSALNTLNELAAAINDDASFSTTITNSIATKLPLAGGTMSGAIAMGTSKITGLGDPTANQDGATKNYVDTTALLKSGGTMASAIAMGNNKITGLGTPTANTDAATKTYVDSIAGSNTAAAASATQAATSATNAATSATNSANSATSAATSATNAANSYDSFDDRYLGAKSSAPTVDNDGDALITGALYFNTTSNIMFVRSSAGGWQAAGSSVNGTSGRNTYTATAGQTTFSATYDVGYVDIYLNGVKLLVGTDVTATSGSTVVLATGATVGDIIDIVGYGTFQLADHYSKTASDARFLGLAGGTMTGDIDGNGNKVLFGNVYSQVSDLPSASTYHGMFAHVHATGKGYFAHAGNWVALANDTEKLNLSGGTMTGNLDVGGSIEFDSLSGTGSVSITDILDEDNMASNSATALATQQSIKAYTDTAVANLVDSSPASLDTLNELAAALGDDASFSTTITNSIATKLPLAGGTLTGNLDVGGTVTADGLTVDGNATISSAAGSLYLEDNNYTAGQKVFGVTSKSGDLFLRSFTDDKLTATNRFGIDHSTGDISFYEDTGTTAKFFWDASAERLGLGTSSPSLSLTTLSGTANTAIAQFTGTDVGRGLRIETASTTRSDDTAILKASDAFGELAFETNSTERMRINSSGQVLVNPLGVSTPSFAFTNDTNTGMTRPTGDTLQFVTGGSERLRIDSSGRVGIGVTSPDNRLVIASGSDGTGNGDGVAFYGGVSNKQAAIESYNVGGYSGDLRFYTGNKSSANTTVTERFRIDSSGHLMGKVPDVKIGADTGSVLFGTVSSNSTKFITNNTERMRIDSSGNLLVGMTSASTNNDGAGIRSDGLIHAKRANVVATFNRKTSNGSIIELAKDNTVVGSIGSLASAYLYIGSTGGTDTFASFHNGGFRPATNTGADNDNALNLGGASGRWKDVYAVTYHGDGSNLTGVGGSTALGAVGTYAYLKNDSGTTRSAGYVGSTSSGYQWGAGDATAQSGSSGTAGSWRCMGYAYVFKCTVWVRIS